MSDTVIIALRAEGINGLRGTLTMEVPFDAYDWAGFTPDQRDYAIAVAIESMQQQSVQVTWMLVDDEGTRLR